MSNLAEDATEKLFGLDFNSKCHTSFVSVETTIEEELLVFLVDNFDDLSTKDLQRENG